ncbi:MAG: hypothetical protein ACREQK_10735 [Candidatus Binatia bacterium]|jgi:hypothetical protein
MTGSKKPRRGEDGQWALRIALALFFGIVLSYLGYSFGGWSHNVFTAAVDHLAVR